MIWSPCDKQNTWKVRTGAFDKRFSENKAVVKEYDMMDSKLVAIFHIGCFSEYLFKAFSV